MLQPHTLNDQVAIITGGGTGLGRAMALEFVRLGARVALASRSMEHLSPTVAEITAQGGEAIVVQTDVRDPAQVDHMIAETKQRFGGVDILINNAAGNFICRAEELSPNGWRAVVDIVLNGTFFCTRAAGREMIAQGRGGKIVSILATYAWNGGPGTVHSAAAKAGVLALTRTLAVEWAPHRIRVNAIAPGPVATEGAGSKLWATPETQQRMLGGIPVGRIGRPEEIAQAAAFLVSPYADYINGEALTMDGGEWLSGGRVDYQAQS